MWNKTNRLAGKLFKAAGILAMLGAIFPEHAIWFILGPVVLAGFYSLIYPIRSINGDGSGLRLRVIDWLFIFQSSLVHNIDKEDELLLSAKKK